jgi:hypothetical protein
MKEKINSALESDISAIDGTQSAAASTARDTHSPCGGRKVAPASGDSTVSALPGASAHQQMIANAVGDIERELRSLRDCTHLREQASAREQVEREVNIARARGLARGAPATPKPQAGLGGVQDSAGTSDRAALEMAVDAVAQAQRRLRERMLQVPQKSSGASKRALLKSPPNMLHAAGETAALPAEAPPGGRGRVGGAAR